MADRNVVIIGSGPYGLGAARHLSRAGVDVAVFGQVMSFWQRYMPQGMLLRSSAIDGCDIGEQTGELTLASFSQATGKPILNPLPLADVRRVRKVVSGRGCPRPRSTARGTRGTAGRRVRGPARGRRIRYGQAGCRRHRHRPLRCGSGRSRGPRTGTRVALDRGRGPHRIHGQRCCRDRRGAECVRIRGAAARARRKRRADRARAGRSFLARQAAARALWPAELARVPTRGCRPTRHQPPHRAPPDLAEAAARHADRDRPSCDQARRGGVARFTPGRRPDDTGTRSLFRRRSRSGRVRLELSDGSERIVDHVVAATGFKVDIAKYPFLAESLLRDVDTREGYPVLRSGFETSSPGLHFLGAPAAWSYGPLMRFVSGTWFASRTIARAIARQLTSVRIGRRRGLTVGLTRGRSSAPPGCPPACRLRFGICPPCVPCRWHGTRSAAAERIKGRLDRRRDVGAFRATGLSV